MKRLGGGVEGTVYKVSDKLVKKVWHRKSVDDVKSKYVALKEKMEKVSDPNVKLVSPKKYYVNKKGIVVTYSRYIPKKPIDHDPWDVRSRWLRIEPRFNNVGICDLHSGNVIYYRKKWYIIDAHVD